MSEFLAGADAEGVRYFVRSFACGVRADSLDGRCNVILVQDVVAAEYLARDVAADVHGLDLAQASAAEAFAERHACEEHTAAHGDE